MHLAVTLHAVKACPKVDLPIAIAVPIFVPKNSVIFALEILVTHALVAVNSLQESIRKKILLVRRFLTLLEEGLFVF